MFIFKDKYEQDKYHSSNLFACFHFSFSGKLNVSSDTVQHGVEGLTYLLTESSKLMVRVSLDCFVLPGFLRKVWCTLHHSLGRYLWILIMLLMVYNRFFEDIPKK